jgi:hypothetical protein
MQTRVGSRYDVSVDRGHDRGLDPRFYWGERQKLGARTFLAGTRRVIERGTELDSGDVPPRKGVQNMTITTPSFDGIRQAEHSVGLHRRLQE